MTHRDNAETVTGRAEALAHAKELSKELGGGVEVRNREETVHIRYQDGQIVYYVLDLPGSGRKKRRPN